MKIITHQEACEKLSKWLNVPLDVMLQKLDGYRFVECRGAIISIKGHEIHATAPEEIQGQWFGKDVVREIMLPILKEYGVIKTHVPDGYPLGLRFVQRLGFEHVGGTSWELRC